MSLRAATCNTYYGCQSMLDFPLIVLLKALALVLLKALVGLSEHLPLCSCGLASEDMTHSCEMTDLVWYASKGIKTMLYSCEKASCCLFDANVMCYGGYYSSLYWKMLKN